MPKPDDMPEDVWKSAVHALHDGFDEPAETVGRAIMAERERCAKAVEEQGRTYGDSDGELYVILVAAEAIRKGEV